MHDGGTDDEPYTDPDERKKTICGVRLKSRRILPDEPEHGVIDQIPGNEGNDGGIQVYRRRRLFYGRHNLGVESGGESGERRKGDAIIRTRKQENVYDTGERASESAEYELLWVHLKDDGKSERSRKRQEDKFEIIKKSRACRNGVRGNRVPIVEDEDEESQPRHDGDDFQTDFQKF